MKFENKVVLITGGGRGIGRAMALAFAKEGASVVINYCNTEPVAVLTEISNLNSGRESKVVAIKADISKEEEVKELISKSIEKFGKIDILINNAGIVFDESYENKTVEHWNQTLNINLVGQFLMIKYSIPFISEGGKIINISSTNAINNFSMDAMDYDASKAGAIVLTKDFAQLLAPKNILVNAIAPGWVDTDMNKDLPEDFVKEETKRIWLNRFAKPEEIAHLALFLASDENTYLTGQTILIDGGHC